MRNPITQIRFAAEAGFTIVELLATMVAGLAVAGALMSFLIVTIDQQNAVSSQTVTTRQAEVGMSQFVRDLRAAQSNADSTATYANRTPMVITYTTGASAHFTASFYLAPSGGCDGTGGSPCLQVQWSCTAASGSVPGVCTRTCTAPTAALATGPCKVSSPPAEPEISGVTSAAITPTDSDGNTIASASGGAPPGTSPTFSYPSYVSLTFTLATISQSDTGATHTLKGSRPVLLQTGVNLRNWS